MDGPLNLKVTLLGFIPATDFGLNLGDLCFKMDGTRGKIAYELMETTLLYMEGVRLF